MKFDQNRMIQVFGFQCTYTLDPDVPHCMPVDSEVCFDIVLGHCQGKHTDDSDGDLFSD